MKKLIYLFALVILASGCATTRRYSALLDTWVGSNEESLIASWGSPQNVYYMNNGKKVIEYSKGQTIQTGGYTYTTPQTTYHQGAVGNTMYYGTSTQYVTQTTPVNYLYYWCKTSFIIGENGRIETWRWEGNNCTSRYKPPEKIQETPTSQNIQSLDKTEVPDKSTDFFSSADDNKKVMELLQELKKTNP